MLEDIVKKVKDGASEVVEAVVEEGRSFRDDHDALKLHIKDLALEKVVDEIDRFDAAVPVFRKVGFELVRFDVEVGLSAGIIARFDIVRAPTEDEHRVAATELRGDTTLETVLRAMVNATRLHRHVQVGDLELSGLVVSISTMPSVRLVFTGAPSPKEP